MAKTFALQLSSEFSEIEKIPGLVDQIDNEVSLDDDLKQRIALTLSEAVTNAVIHGNREDKNKKVAISILVTESSVLITVEDEGRGFDPGSVADPVQSDNLLKTGGRGLFLMDQYCDDIAYSNGGRTVTLTFER